MQLEHPGGGTGKYDMEYQIDCFQRNTVKRSKSRRTNKFKSMQ